jgi:hypothetical protein
MDISTMALSLAQKLSQEQSGRRPWFVAGSVTALPFKPGIIEKIVAADLTEHLTGPDFTAMLAESKKVLRAGGSLGIYTPSPTHLFEVLKEKNMLELVFRLRKEVPEGLKKLGAAVDVVTTYQTVNSGRKKEEFEELIRGRVHGECLGDGDGGIGHGFERAELRVADPRVELAAEVLQAVRVALGVAAGVVREGRGPRGFQASRALALVERVVDDDLADARALLQDAGAPRGPPLARLGA